jgi:hypothetical protein
MLIIAPGGATGKHILLRRLCFVLRGPVLIVARGLVGHYYDFIAVLEEKRRRLN